MTHQNHSIYSCQSITNRPHSWRCGCSSQVPNEGEFVIAETQADRISRHVHHGLNEEELAPAREFDRARVAAWKDKQARDARDRAERDRQEAIDAQNRRRHDAAQKLAKAEHDREVAKARGEALVGPANALTEQFADQMEKDVAVRNESVNAIRDIERLNAFCRNDATVSESINRDGGVDVIIDRVRMSECFQKNMSNGMPKLVFNRPESSEPDNLDRYVDDCNFLMKRAVGVGASTGAGIGLKLGTQWCIHPPSREICIAAATAVGAFGGAVNARRLASMSDVCVKARTPAP